jgi:Tol biopolymer transport system component
MIGAAAAQTRGLQSSDLLKLRSVGEVKSSPDGSRLAYTVINNDGPGRPYSQLWIMTVADNKSIRLGGEKEPSSNPEWSPDGRSIAYEGRIGDKSGLIVANADGSNA